MCVCVCGPGWLNRYSDSLRAGRSGDGIPVGARFSTPVQTGPGAHPASCTMGTGSFPGVKRPGRGADHPPPSTCRGQERVGLYLYSPSGPSSPVMGAPLPLPIYITEILCKIISKLHLRLVPSNSSITTNKPTQFCEC